MMRCEPGTRSHAEPGDCAVSTRAKVITFPVAVRSVIALGAVVFAVTTARPQQTTFRSSVELVLIDVRVTDRSGKPIIGLGPEQFSVTEDGHPQKIASFEYCNIEAIETASPSSIAPMVVPIGAPALASESVRAAVQNHRLIVLFFDLTALHPDDLLRA
ncbi:MAG: hypothetical protein JO217_08415, partial [Acidobacteriaceae bacterium]|nr:hypothetical protein [Acidobacteriaceae bacterium]